MTTRAVTVLLNAVTGPYEASMARASATTARFGGTAKAATGKTGMLGGAMGGLTGKLIAGGGLVMAGQQALDMLMDYETALVGVGKTTGLSGDALNELGVDIQTLSTKIAGGSEELLGIAQAAAQLGVGNDDIVEFTEVIANMASATDLTTESAATDMARLSNILDRPISEVEALGSSIVALGNNMATTEPEILAMANRLAAASRNAGLTDADVTGLAAAMSSLGIEAEAGGTAMSRVLNEITKAAATGGDSLQAFAETAGMSADDFATAWSEDPSAALEAFIGGLSELGDADRFAVLDELGLDGMRLIDVISRLEGGTHLLAQGFELSNEAMEENVALAEEAEVANATLRVATENLVDAIKMQATEMLGAADTTGPLASGVQWVAENFGTLTGVITDTARSMNPLGAAWNVYNEATADTPRVLTEAEVAQQDLNQTLADAEAAAGAAMAGSRDYEGASGDLEGQLGETEEAQVSLSDAIRSATDPYFAVLNGANNYEDALTELREVEGDSEASAEDLSRARLRVAEAAASLSSDEAALAQALQDGTVSVDDLRIVLDRLGDDAPEALREVVAAAESAEGDALLGGQEIGDAMGRGLEQGIWWTRDLVAASLVNNVNNATEAAKLAMRIQSPSRVMAEVIGRPMSEGIAEGILEKADEPASAIAEVMSRVQERATDEFGNVMDGITATMGVGDARDKYREAEDELRRLRRSGAPAEEIDDALAEARAARLRLVQAQMRQWEAGAALAAQGPAAGQRFMRAARAAGLTYGQAEDLRAQAGAAWQSVGTGTQAAQEITVNVRTDASPGEIAAALGWELGG